MPPNITSTTTDHIVFFMSGYPSPKGLTWHPGRVHITTPATITQEPRNRPDQNFILESGLSNLFGDEGRDHEPLLTD